MTSRTTHRRTTSQTTRLARAVACCAAGAMAVTGLVALSVPAAAAVPTCDGRPATIVAPAPTWPRTWVVGTEGDDVIVGTDGWDLIDGRGGNDVICGLDSSDHIVGGPGDDRLFGGLDEYFPDDDYWGDVIEPGPGDDYVDLGADLGPEDLWWGDSVYADQVSYASATGPVRVDLTTLTATGQGTDTFAATPAGTFTGVTGSPYDDVLVGGPAADQIHGGGGDDTITGGEGDDLLSGDQSTPFEDRNTEVYVPGSDRVSGGPGDDIIDGGWGRDVLTGDDGDDYLWVGDDARGTTLSGGSGEDRFRTGAGTTARGGSGDDELIVPTGRGTAIRHARTLAGGGGRDRVTFESYVGGRTRYPLAISVPRRRVDLAGRRLARLTGAEEFVVVGNDGKGLITFRGGRASELFRVRWIRKVKVKAWGGAGADTLIGSTRADLLDGGPGRDRLVGGDGRDRCLRGERLRSCEVRR